MIPFLSGAGFTALAGGDGRLIGKNTLLGGLRGLISGGVISGISSGFHSVAHDGNFWTGERTTYYEFAKASSQGVNETPENYNEEYLNTFADKNMPEMKEVRAHISSLNAGAGPNARFLKTGHFRITKGIHAGDNAYGYSTYLNKTAGWSIWISKASFSSTGQLILTLGHEFLHVAYGLGNYVSADAQHASIYKWQMAQGKKFYLKGGIKAKNKRFSPYWNSKNDAIWKQLLPIKGIQPKW